MFIHQPRQHRDEKAQEKRRKDEAKNGKGHLVKIAGEIKTRSSRDHY
jgi:hypothetical protein